MFNQIRWSVLALWLTSAGLASEALAEARPSGWSTPVNIGTPINTPYRETGARLSSDGLSLYFSSDRPCGADDAVLDFNLWVARRKSRFSRWQEPQCLAINANPRMVGEAPPYQDREPELSRDQHWLYFVSDRPGSAGPPVPAGGDIWVSWRNNIRDDNSWTEPFRVVGLNTEASERAPQYFAGGSYGRLPQLFFTTSRGGSLDIWVVNILGGAVVGESQPVAELNTPDLFDAGGTMNRNGREMFLFRGVNGPALDIYTATRPNLHAAWSAPVKVDAVNSPVADQEVTLSRDGRLLFFSSNRSGSTLSTDGVTASLDIWVAARRCASSPGDEHEEYEEGLGNGL